MTQEEAQENALSTREIKQQLLQIAEDARDASLLLPTGFKLRNPSLYTASIKAFGSWESTLAELVLLVRDKEAFLLRGDDDEEDPQGADATADEGLHFPDRAAAPAATEPLPVLNQGGELVILDGEAFPVTRGPASQPEGLGQIAALAHQGPKADLVLFSTAGNYFGMVHDFLPSLDDLRAGASIRQRLDLAEGEQIFQAVSRDQYHPSDQRLIHVTTGGKAKATELGEYTQQFGRAGREAFLLKDDDAPLTVLIGPAFDGLFCASSQGQGIHMGTSDIRSMGRKSVGVNVMKLSGAHDYVIAAFLTEGVEEIAVMTAQGYGKRLPFREFRRQGRGGAGMQVLRLNANDEVIGVTPVSADGDVAIATDQGRWWRFPASLLPQMGRPARGKRLFDLVDGEQVTLLSALPCGGNPEASQEQTPEGEEKPPAEALTPTP